MSNKYTFLKIFMNLFQDNWGVVIFVHLNLSSFFYNNIIYIIDNELPNDFVDKNSQESLTCYPRRTFDRLSESPSPRGSHIIMPEFHLCPTCRSPSQAALASAYLRTPTFIFRRHPSQMNYPPRSIPPSEWSVWRLGNLRRMSGSS